jgi:hypothetical protein
MRRFLVLISFLVSLAVSGAPSITVSPAAPLVGQPVTFTLVGAPMAINQNWRFGDDSSANGSSIVTHAYAAARQYHVAVFWTYPAGGSDSANAVISVVTAPQKGPSAPFSLTSVILRWKDGQSSLTVPKGTEGLKAYADIKFEGTGPFQAQWLVDGQVVSTVSQTLSFAGKATLDSGAAPALPTSILGPHDVTLRVLNPAVTFRLPVIRYVVSPEAPQPPPPTVESLYPASVSAGEESEIQVTGQNLSTEMKLDFGSGITLVGPITLMSPRSAKVKVFVPPTAKPGFHLLSMVRGKDRLPSKAQLEVKHKEGGARKIAFGAMPCPDAQTFKKGVITLMNPDWGPKGGEFGWSVDWVPTLTDFTLFQWLEPVKGAAQYFELRIYDKTGTTLLMTRRLPGNSESWDATPDFAPALVNLVKGQGSALASLKVQNAIAGPGATDGAKAGAGKPGEVRKGLVLKPSSTTAETAAQAKADQQAQADAKAAADRAARLAKVADVLWQIVGLREYTCLPRTEDDASTAPQPMKVLRPGTTPTRTLEPAQELPAGKAVAQTPASRPLGLKPSPAPLSPLNAQGGQAPQTADFTPVTPSTPVELAPQPVKLTLEVEASEFRPLKLPDQAVGIVPGQCSATVRPSGLSAVSQAGGGDVNHYPGDAFLVSGNFTLQGSPYGSTDKNNTNPNRTSQVLDNLFLDWGDGSPLVALTPNIANISKYGPDEIFSYTLPAADPKLKHAYQKEGQYIIRVFTLSEDDVQMAGLTSSIAKDLSPQAALDTDFSKLLKVATNGFGLTQVNATGTPNPGGGFTKIGGTQYSNSAMAAALQSMGQPSLQSVLSRAYVIFCDTKTISPFKDPCAIKPLELVSLDLSFDVPTKRKLSAATSTQMTAVQAQHLKIAGQSGPAKPGKAVSTLQKPSPDPILINLGSTLSVDAVTNNCNGAFTAHTKVRYFGHGFVKVVWTVDGDARPYCETGPIELSMTGRTGLTKAQAQSKDCSTVQPAEQEIPLPEFLPVTAGMHTLSASAMVVPDPGKPNLSQAILDLGKGDKFEMTPGTIALLGAASNGSGKKPPLKVGLLNPHPAPGMPQVVYLNDALPNVAKTLKLGSEKEFAAIASAVSGKSTNKGPFSAAELSATMAAMHARADAPKKTYRVDALDPKEPCSVDFPTSGGTFRVTNLGKNVTTQVVGGVTRMSGSGTMIVPIRISQDTVDKGLGVPIQLDQWETDGLQVTKGEVKLAGLNQPLLLAGLKGTLDALRSKVQGKGKTEDMKADMTLSASDASLVFAANAKQGPQWTVTDVSLGSEGDFYVDNLDLPSTVLGVTPWQMKTAKGVVLDYSHTKGGGPAGQGNEWVGVRLKNLVLTPFSFDLPTYSTLPTVDSWFIGNRGLEGSVSFKDWKGTYQDGTIKVGSMNFNALGDQNYTADYMGTEVQLPWFPTPLKGDVTASRNGDGKFIFVFKDVKAASMPAVVNGNFSLTPANLYFVNEPNVAWAVMGDAIMDFKANGKPLASFTINDFCYHFDGRASFEKNVLSRTIALNKKSSLGQTPADLKSVVINTPNSGPNLVDFNFNTTLRLSDSPLLPAADTVVSYHLQQAGKVGSFAATPAATAPFDLAMSFPMGSPTIQGKISPVYQPNGDGNGGTRYTGSVDLGLFGGPPIKTQFVLGYKGGKDYFLCRADVPLGPTGQVIVPELLTLYKIHGGLGYNFGVDAFKDNVSILDAQPDMKGNALFSAGMRVGSSDGFIYMLDGTMTISTAAAARMDYDAWLLSHDHSGKGQFKGFLQYGSGSFDGRMWGGLNLLGGLVQFSLGDSESNAAVDLHLGSDSWHVYAGQRDGARIKAKVITSGSDSYLMLGSKEGLAIGGSQSYDFEVGDSSVASAYARAYLDVGLQVTPQPKIIGDFGAGVSAGVCVFGVCVDGGADAAVHAEALPLSMRATCTLDLGWYLGGDYSFTVNM